MLSFQGCRLLNDKKAVAFIKPVGIFFIHAEHHRIFGDNRRIEQVVVGIKGTCWVSIIIGIKRLRGIIVYDMESKQSPSHNNRIDFIGIGSTRNFNIDAVIALLSNHRLR